MELKITASGLRKYAFQNTDYQQFSIFCHLNTSKRMTIIKRFIYSKNVVLVYFERRYNAGGRSGCVEVLKAIKMTCIKSPGVVNVQ